MDNLPLHKISEKAGGEIAFIKRIRNSETTHITDYAHRDNYYIFIFIEKGDIRILIDFEEYCFAENSIFCILPGQVHLLKNHNDVTAWILGVNPLVVKEAYKEIFETSLLKSGKLAADNDVNYLYFCFSAISERLNHHHSKIDETLLHDLISCSIGMIAETYYAGLSEKASNRYASITYKFKRLLSVNYKQIKNPSQYASMMNLSSVYLNEAVKNTTGISVSRYISGEIMIQAQRLLFYTDMSVKEIALELGYDDPFYFTRLFTKITEISPTRFREKYLK